MLKKLLLLLLAGVVVAGVAVRQRIVEDFDLFAVQTGSMGDAAPIGAVVATTPADRLAVGDIVTYDLQNGEIITHRVIAVDDGVLTTKGDTNAHTDPWRVDQRSVRGVVDRVYPDAGYVLRYLTLPVGAASLVSAVVTVVLAWRLFFPGRRSGRDGAHLAVA